MNRGRARGRCAACLGAMVLTVSCASEDTAMDASLGCETTPVPAHDTNTVVIEGDAWSGFAPFRDPALLDGTGYTALYIEQPCQEARAAHLTSGEADMALTSLDQYLFHQPAATVVGVVDQSQGADALVLDTLRYPYFDGVDDVDRLVEELDGRRPVLAYTASSPSEMLLNQLANTTEGFRLAEFELMAVDDATAPYQMLQSGEAQLVVLAEPETSTARDSGFTVALSSADVPDSLVDVIVAGDRLVAGNPPVIRAVLAAFYTAVDRYLADRRAFVELIAEDTGWNEAEAAALVDGIRLYGTADADVFLNEAVFPLDQPQAARSLQAVGSTLALVHPDLELGEGTVDGSFVAEIFEARYGSTGGDIPTVGDGEAPDATTSDEGST